MPNVIVKVPTYSNGEINKALERELRTGFELKRVSEEARHKDASELAAERRTAIQNGAKKDIKGLGRSLGFIPKWEYFQLIRKYGREEVLSNDFIKYWQRKMPELKVNGV